MENKNIFENENVKLRLIDLEYDYKEKFASNIESEIKRAKTDFEVEVRRIYKEETHRDLPKNLEIYTSNELIKKNSKIDTSIRESGYDGTAIYIKDDKQHVNQLHIISEGSADNEDWSYNFFGLFLGIDDSQYQATKEFVRNAKRETENSNDLKTFAMGHSLANNNQVMVQLIDGEFDEVYGVNGAQISVDHLLATDLNLRDRLMHKFHIRRLKDINDIPPEKLKKEIQKYYEDKGVTANITQRISKDDPLYGVSGKADFITFGDVKMADTNTSVKGIRNIMDGVPDEDVRSIQKFLQKYKDDYEKDGLNGFIKAASGIDIDLIEKVKNTDGALKKVSVLYEHFDDVKQMYGRIKEELPSFLGFLHTLLRNSGPVVDQLAENGYIDETQKKVIKKELTNINASMRGIESRYEHFIDHLKHGQFMQALKDVGEIVDYVKSILSSLKTLDTETKDALKLIVDGHSIVQMLNALSKEKGFSYKGSDIYFTGKSGSGETIQVNLSSAVRIYQNGMKIVEDMEDAISKYQKVYSQEIDEDFIDKKQAITTAIHHMEENPSHYAFDLQFRLAAGFSHTFDKLEKISVHESFHTGALPANDGIVAELKKQTTEKRDFIKNIRESIEKLFEKEEMISQLFDFQP
ncbi:hypothetical protein P4V37_15615 [Bacillus subtilis]|jgi:hypothetical protein|nr:MULTISPECIES: DUF6792 domain-containing protein [Bacillus]MBW4825197.1 hypothetical protein [Bacillaceae bacterium]AJO59855.1 hypothetical protein QF06_15805 [Bacillus sp. YP1]AOR99853.1 Putative uncharacterized protein YvcB [Bacillus subtilis]ARW00363.1 Putative uncharacterized protein YvcB [Bacillus subtilis subsp. subtilis]ARW04432.1 Putative uncharacterized protein YvcB [Bacillus subtilis subsp. subtilis]